MLLNKFVFHRHGARSGDATRGGLIRPLGWMFLFPQLGIKNLMRFVEKFGMPFVSARVDESAWEKDRTKIAYLIRNFGSDGGAVFSKAVELNFIETATSGGDVYFKLMDYFSAAKQRVIQGQTASSGDAGGFSKGQPQENVRQDILRSDCETVARTVRAQILRPWTVFNYGSDAPVPELFFDLEESEDLEAKSRTILNLTNAGYRPTAEQVSSDFGMEIEDVGQPARGPALTLGADGAEQRRAQQAAPLRSRAVLARRRVLAAQAHDASEQVAETALDRILGDRELSADWLGPVQDAIDEALAGLPDPADPATTPEVLAASERTFRDRLGALIEGQPKLYRAMDSRRLEDEITQAMFAGDTNGRLQAVSGIGA
jgi:phage gp29-like protein